MDLKEWGILIGIFGALVTISFTLATCAVNYIRGVKAKTKEETERTTLVQRTREDVEQIKSSVAELSEGQQEIFRFMSSQDQINISMSELVKHHIDWCEKRNK